MQEAKTVKEWAERYGLTEEEGWALGVTQGVARPVHVPRNVWGRRPDIQPRVTIRSVTVEERIAEARAQAEGAA